MGVPSALQISLVKTLYLSARFRGQIVVMRGTRVCLQRGARIELAPGARLYLGRNHYGGGPLVLRIDRCGRLSIGGVVQISQGSRIVVAENAHLEIENEVFLNYNAAITCWDHISIGHDSMLSWDVNVIDGNFHEISLPGKVLPRTRPLRIGSRVLIGVGAIVAGASIGDGSVVGAGSVVRSDLPPGVIASGNPASVTAKDISWRP
jgi:acetyltransferase-like isoleucine patch superfamily enzyme